MRSSDCQSHLPAWRSEAALEAQRLGQVDRASALVDEELARRTLPAPRPIGIARPAAGLLARGEDATEFLPSASVVLGDWLSSIRPARYARPRAALRAEADIDRAVDPPASGRSPGLLPVAPGNRQIADALFITVEGVEWHPATPIASSTSAAGLYSLGTGDPWGPTLVAGWAAAATLDAVAGPAGGTYSWEGQCRFSMLSTARSP